MIKRFERKLALLAKAEVTYGVDATPTGAANAILATEADITAIEADEVKRNLYLPYLGAQETLWAGHRTIMKFKVEMAGAGAAGSAPGYGPLLRACGLAETLTALIKADYEPVSEGFESASLYMNLDGVNHVMLGARGSVKLSMAPRDIPKFEFDIQGLMGPIADVALPAQTLTGFQKPLIVSKANTPVFSIHGFAAIAENFSLDLAHQVEPRFLIGQDSIEIVDRGMSASAVVEATSLAEKNWFQIALDRAKGAIAIEHGTVAGNIVEIAAPAAELGKPSYGATQGIRNITLPMSLIPVAGDDEFKITVR